MPKDGNDVPAFVAAFDKEQTESKKYWPLNETPPTSDVRGEMCKMYGNALGDRRMLMISCKLLLLRIQTGKLPDTLPDFGPQLLDPNTGQPFAYQKVGNGFKLYSPAQLGVAFEFK